ncbi:hypothetical protein BCR39DRAFT_304495 [Naematelia encephala]|uniref:Transcription activator of gluconeogenesis ERT1 n=1 Tax=Naematelia encephala TaxID=71784 RepID=A0A1Y2BFB2_9TREE|nr:hypothetical protein BCR39DRAFT_304495 [Naematelia encephala]
MDTPAFDGPGARTILGEAGGSGSTSPTTAPGQNPPPRRVGGKSNVSAACGPCKRAHLACDVARPCKRCINMGKEELCEDVPHKKRGRPKVPKPMPEPYARSRPTTAESSTGGTRWRGVAPSTTTEATQSSGGSGGVGAGGSGGGGPSTIPYLAPPPDPSVSPSPQVFELFTTTDLKIIRVTTACYALTGFHPHEYVNSSLLDWIHPSAKYAVDAARHALPALSGGSNRATEAAMIRLANDDLRSPAEGMPEPYPNVDAHILRADGAYRFFNVRLHVGAGLGASLWRPETLEHAYLVISLLLQEPPRPPPTPITPLAGQSLPSFSSFAAAAEARPQAYYPQQPPTARSSVSSSSALPYPPRSHSPGSYFRPPMNAYPPPPPPPPPSAPNGAYLAAGDIGGPLPVRPGVPLGAYRQTSDPRIHAVAGPSHLGAAAGPPSSAHGDPSRRTWEL